MRAFFSGSLPGSLATMPETMARAGAWAFEEGEVCAGSAADAATTIHNRDAGKNFIFFLILAKEWEGRGTRRRGIGLSQGHSSRGKRIDPEQNFFPDGWCKISGINELRAGGYAGIRLNPWK
jgi:hypothetical protein